jgi:hypothetical protein
VINGKGEKSPLKNVLDIMPMETDTIEFLANEEGDWFFHCHILYHMMAGMNRVFEVGDYKTLSTRQGKAYNNCKEKVICLILWHKTILQPMVMMEKLC